VTVGALLLGLVNGLSIGLLAVGLVLVYKSNRFLNLAHAQLGTLSALLLSKWVLDWGWNFWVSFALAIAVGAATGLAVDRFLISPLKDRGGSPLRLLLLSLAVSQLLLALTFIPALGPDVNNIHQYPQPFSSHLEVGDVLLTGMSLLTAVLVPLLALGLALFMRYSVLGRQIRAAANNPEAARSCGISVRRVSAIAWGIAGGLSAVSAVMQAPNQPNFNVAALGPYLLMLTLGAAALGAFVSLPLALAGGVGLGVISQVVAASTKNGSDAEIAVFAAIVLVVLVRGAAISRVFAVSGGAVDAVPVTRVPDAMRRSTLVRHQRLWLAAVGTLVALLVPHLPWFDTAGNRFLLTLVLIYALVGVGMTLLVGWAGQVSLGHFALLGLGAYLAARWSADGWSLPAMMIVAGIVGAAAMVIVGLPALRVGGLTLTVTTMGFAVIAADWLFHQSWVGSTRFSVDIAPAPLGPGLGTPSSELSIYHVALVVLLLGVAAAGALRRFGPGRQVIAVRDNERAAMAFGVFPASVKLTILAVSGLFAGMAGVLWGEAWRVASPEQFPPDLSLALVAIPVIGGLGSIGGAVMAAVLLYSSTFFIGPHLTPLFGHFGQNQGFQLFLAGGGQVGVLLTYPTGIAGTAQARWQSLLNRLAARRAGEAQPDAPDEQRVASGATVTDQLATARMTPDPIVADTTVAGASGHPDLRLADRVAGNWDADGLPLACEGVRVRFGGVVALDGPDIHVGENEIVGLIGPNGAGKTTLMNVISGVQTVQSGSVRLFGREVADLPADLRASLRVARSFQDATLFPGLTVLETLQVALSYRHKVGVLGALVAAPWVRAEDHRVRAEAERIAERFGLGPWGDALTHELSTGTRRICDLAAQVAARPELLLLDEPTAGVAQREAEAFGPLLRRIRDELGCSVLIIEHDMPLLMGLCNRVYVMQLGRVIAEGSPEEIRHNPDVVASYLGYEDAARNRSGPVRTRTTVAAGGGARS
jgi:ABC-type branched-subunit amino acid transport system ATPase component/branched-subunit amino acid ABC-type transport system permease component